MQNKIIFLDIDGVLNDHSALSIYADNAIDINMIHNLNLALEKTGAKIVIISNWSQVLNRDRLIEVLTSKGILKNSIIDVIRAKEIERNGLILQVIEKGSFIYEYVNMNNIKNYVVVDDDLKSNLIDESKLIVPLRNPEFLALSLGITQTEVNKIINILNG